MPFHWPNKNNRSQHNLVGSTGDEGDAPGPVSGAGAGPGAATSAAATGSTPNSAGTGTGGGAGAANTPAALSNPAFSSSESFQAQQHSQPPPPPPHLANLYNTNAAASYPAATNISQLQHSNTVTGSLESRQTQRDSDFADPVTRSQSHRYPQQGQQVSPVSTQYPSSQQIQQIQQIQQQQQQHQQQQQLHQLHHQQQQQQFLTSGSAEDLTASSGHSLSPVPSHSQPQSVQAQGQQAQSYYVQQPQQPQQPQPQRTKQSTRKLIKNILSGSSHRNTESQARGHLTQSPYTNDSDPALGRRPSKRVSRPPAPPPAIRTGVSQLSLDQQIDWQNQPPPSQPSPLQSTAEFIRRESYVVLGADGQELHSQHPHGIQHNPTIRSVPPSDSETSPYSPDDIGYHHHRQSHTQLQGQQQQIPPELQHQGYGQTAFDPAQQQQQQQYQFANTQHLQYQGGNQPIYSGRLANPQQQQQNAETISQLSHESPVTDSDQRSATNIQPPQSSPAVADSTETQDLPVQQNPPSSQAQSPQQTMAPPQGGPPPPRRSQETEKGMRDPVQPPPGPPPSYRQSQTPNMNNPLPPPPPNSGGGSGAGYRASAADRPPFDGQGDGQGRNSPQPTASSAGEDPEKAFKDLLTKYKNVKRLYFDGKKEIEQLNGQVEQLQNAIANQRMSQSRTSLDDNEYTTRFNRLNGAINNLSFNIRKDWVTLPSWLDPFVSPDAIKTGKQEMTAVGRAVITRWLVDEIFNRCFHPGLNFELSRQLKQIEQNIRHFSYTLNSQEEFDALTSKVVAWRMATLEGLQDVLRSGEAATHKSDFTRAATGSLTNCLYQHLSDPPPMGVDGSAAMIVELAVGIAANLPMESRDVAILYPLPEQPIDPHVMEVEKTGLPVLESRGSDVTEDAGDEGGKDGSKDAKDRRGDKGRSAPSAPKGSDSGKVRFAGFVAVEVRGRQVLVRAPVWTL